jgi:hypothetical protein
VRSGFNQTSTTSPVWTIFAARNKVADFQDSFGRFACLAASLRIRTRLTWGDMLRCLRLELSFSRVPSHVPITSTCRPGIVICDPEIGAVA